MLNNTIKVLTAFLFAFVAGYPGFLVFTLLCVFPLLEKVVSHFAPEKVKLTESSERLQTLEREVREVKERLAAEALRRGNVRG